MAGYAGRFLKVNLTTGKIETEPLPEKLKRNFVGGRGFGISYLYSALAPGTDPLGEDNPLLFLNGPLAGTNAQSVSRWIVATKSPLTGGFARAVSGADFGAWLKFAGYDFVAVEGKSPSPVYLYLTREGCQIRDADELWGKDTQQTQEMLRRVHGEHTRSACIGPAGEKLVLYAAIASARRTASRCGVGTVMGAKKLKAIAVAAERKIDLHDPETFKELVKAQIKSNQEDMGYHSRREWGTTAGSSLFNRLGIFPVRNFRAGQQENFKNFSGEEYRKLRQGDVGCYSCSMRCAKRHRLTEGPYAGASSDGPEYESIWAFTGSIDSTDVAATIVADKLCDELGLDTISTGNTIGFAYELFEKGILTKADTDGVELRYGNYAAMLTLVEKIGRREGIGDLLAQGTRRAARVIGKGAEEYAMESKGSELPGYDPRGVKAQGLSYATSNIGASHCYGYAHQEIFGTPEPRKVDRFVEEGKGEITVYNQDSRALMETGIVCSFAAAHNWFVPLYGKMLYAATGIREFADWSYLKKVAEKIYNLERVFNLREGFSRKDDTLPKRILTDPLLQAGPSTGKVIENWERLLQEYYSARGWTKEGVPTKGKLRELGLEFVIKDIPESVKR